MFLGACIHVYGLSMGFVCSFLPELTIVCPPTQHNNELKQMFLVGSKVCAIYKEKTGLEPPSEVHVCLFCTHLSLPTIFGTGRRVFGSHREREKDMQ